MGQRECGYGRISHTKSLAQSDGEKGCSTLRDLISPALWLVWAPVFPLIRTEHNRVLLSLLLL